MFGPLPIFKQINTVDIQKLIPYRLTQYNIAVVSIGIVHIIFIMCERRTYILYALENILCIHNNT